MAVLRVCSVEGCDNAIHAKGWCNPHYKRWRRHGDPLGGGTGAREARRYFDEIVLPYTGDDCLIWPYARGRGGYGVVGGGARTDGVRKVHRLACEHRHGSPPTPKYDAAHSCGKGHEGCVNPMHLSWKTRAENHADKLIHGTHCRGARNYRAKLTEADVLEIRALRGFVTQRELGKRFEIDQSTVCQIQKGERWGWMEDGAV